MSQIEFFSENVSFFFMLNETFSGVELFRGSDCFVYWCDPQNGLTWGLNFITSEDASYFVDIVVSTLFFSCLRD